MDGIIGKAWRREGVVGRALRAILLPVSWVYGAAAAVHRVWRRGLPRFDREVPVVLVGNLTVGGTGKTPIAIAVAERLRQLGVRPAVVSRGYGGRRRTDPAVVSDARAVLLEADAAGDEPVLAARRLPGVPVVVGRDRVAAARLAVDRLGARSIVLDDGFQQRARFPRALKIVAVKATDPWGGDALLPAGSLREPLRGLAAADIIVVTHPGIGEEALRRIEERIRALAPRAAVFRADHWLAELAEVSSFGASGGVSPEGETPGVTRAVGWLKGRTVLAMAAIADPWPFEARLQRCGGRLAASCVRPDHHRWTPREVELVMDEAVRVGADAIVTTAKDAVRLPLPARPPVPVLVARMELRFVTDRERARFAELIQEHVRPHAGAPDSGGESGEWTGRGRRRRRRR